MTEVNGSPTPETPRRPLVAGAKTHFIIAVVSLGLLAGLGAIGLAHLNDQTEASLLSLHGPALIGTPFAILVATTLVAGARAVDGEFGGTLLGVELKGGGATLFAWLAVFSAIVLAIRALW